jgi:hypothetical protein
MDQLVSEPDLETLYGYIGRKFSPTFVNSDSYVIESSADRQNYQLEPSIVIRDKQKNITFFASYLDLLAKIRYYGGITTDQSRLFEQEYYTFDPLISYDKFVNFSQYYWTPSGPDPVEVSTSGVDLTVTYTVERDAPNNRYIFKNNGVGYNSIILARGGVYEFVVDQPGHPLWIQTELGTDGKLIATPTLSSRTVLGVENNGTDQGTITFRVPQSTAQDRFLNMPIAAEVEYAAPLPYAALQNKTVSQFLAAYPQYGGITGQLNGKELIFINSSAYDNLGEAAWTNANVNYGSQTANVANVAIGAVGTNTLKLNSVQNVYANLIITGTGIPAGTTVVNVSTGGSSILQTFLVTTVPNPDTPPPNSIYQLNGANKPILTLIRGGVYTFDQSSASNINHPLAFQDSTGAAFTRGVISTGTPGTAGAQTVFTVPSDAPDSLLYRCTTHGNGMGNTIIVSGVNITLSANLTANAAGSYSFVSTEYNSGYNVPDADRFDVWKVVYVDAGITNSSGGIDYLVQLVRTTNINTNEKVYIRYGLVNANKLYYKDFDGFLKEVPLITATLNNLWIQDATVGTLYQPVQIVEYAGWTIDANEEIIGKQNYTSPNGVEFTSGLKVQFGDDVTPASYQNRQFYVELVGDLGSGIRLVPVDELVTPEAYNDENATNYPLIRIILSEQVTENIPTGTTILIGTTSVLTYEEVILGKNYITTLTSVDQSQIGEVVSGLGIPEGSIVSSVRLNTVFPDYITINKASRDRNAWSRNNRWTHVDVILATAEYNGVQPVFDQSSRAQRPIIQFESDIQLINEGRVAKAPIDILDTTTLNAFTDLQGKTFSTAFGITLFDGLRVVFAADQDPLVNSKIYVVNLVQYDVDSFGRPSGPIYINLTLADDGEVDAYSTVVVKLGEYKGSQWWYDGVQWNESQQKTSLQQAPLFDILDNTGKSISTYPRSTFRGTKIFSYVEGTGTVDPVLGFALSYKTFQTQGDIKFQNYFNTDTFEYITADGVLTTDKINLNYIQKIRDAATLVPKNTWLTVPEASRQYQQISYIYDGSNNPFPIDITPVASVTIPSVKVFQNFVYLDPSNWTLANNEITLLTLTEQDEGDQIDILIYSRDVSKLGFYQVPQNLDLNAQNIDIDTLTLGQIRNHLIAQAQNSTILVGEVLAQSNLRDIDIKQQGGTILQHSAPTPYASLFLIDEKANFVNGLRFAQQEYTRFKNKFLELSTSLNGINADDPVASVDLIITRITQVKNRTFPWYYSDMVPYGPLKNIVGQIGSIDGFEIFDPLKLNYEITEIFNDQELSNKAVLVYLNNVQLIRGIEYNFSTDTPSINFTTELAVGDIVKIVEYSNTDGNYIPETPSKLGLWPTYVPEIFLDDTYRVPTTVIRGHDGSITPSFGDYRDQFLLELEKRIYNNIKLPQNSVFGDIFRVIPGKFRDSDYSLAEINQLSSIDFLNWIGNNKLDYSTNDTFDPNDQFTWNYAESTDRIDGSKLQGSWRACYQYFYDTIRPHITPWEMLGFSAEPDWWQAFYGPGPYTGGNKLLWDDLEAGLIRYGDRAGVDINYRRPGLSAVIPVDVNGNLLSPAQALSRSFNSKRTASAWAIGQYGPVEFAWRNSSEFPYAIQQALALAKPGRYFGSLIDTYNYTPLNLLNDLDELPDGTVAGSQQYLTRTTNHHLTQDAVNFNGNTNSGTVYRGSGYINWVADYLTNLGINPTAYLIPLLENFQVNLGYKLAGFTDQRYLEVLAEQVSPTSTNASVLVPDENYKIYLNENPVPVDKIVYSAVIVEKTTNGYSVRGYDLFNSYFTIIPSVVNSNASRITVQNRSATIYNNYQNLKLQVPYGYEFTTPQQVSDFLISYERFLVAQGFTFTETDPTLNEIRNFRLSVKEFLYWSQQGWKPGSIIVLSPVAETINAISVNSITAGIEDSQYGSKVLDQNFGLVKNNNYTVVRTPNTFKLSLNNSASVIAYVEVNLVQYEHALVFDNLTVFNDVIYQPESGSRQYRLKLVGQKTAAWDGSLSPAGFIYNSGVVATWNQGRDYLKGDLVDYKNQYYTALQDVAANPAFQFQFWQQIDASQIRTGLLPNFSTLAVQSQGYYDSYSKIRDEDQLSFSHALIGFKPRQYLADLGLSRTTQIEFYKGFIKQKGTANAVNEMLTATFNNLSSDIKFYEEWAMRVGEYGALDSNPFVEIPLDEQAFGANPSVARFLTAADNNLADGVSSFNQSQLYKSYGSYTGNVALNRNQYSNVDNDIPTAGYVNIDDVDLAIFDLADYVDLNNDIANMGSGYTIWVAKDFTQDWNVYRVTETNNSVRQVANASNGYVTFTTKTPHGFISGDIFLVKDFLTAFNGFYQVHRVMSLNEVMVTYAGSTANLTTLSGSGMLLRMDSMRFKYIEDSRIYGLTNPPNGWKVGDKIWIDDDAETTAVQGQPFGTQPNGTWKVYEKQTPWTYQQELLKGLGSYTTDDGYGTSIKMSADGLIVVAGSPQSGVTGSVSTFLKNYEGVFLESFSISPLGANTRTFGSAVDLATRSDGSVTLGVGAPTSFTANANVAVGLVYIYNKSLSSTSFERGQVLVGNTGDLFGTSLAFNQTGEWVYVGAPGTNRMYAYGLNRFISPQEQVTSVNDKNILTINDGILANIGDIISQPATGARATIVDIIDAGNLEVDNVTNFYYGANIIIANVTVDATVFITSGAYVNDTARFPRTKSNISITNSIPLTFVPEVIINGNVDPNSLLITNDGKTYIPTVDYVIVSNVLAVGGYDVSFISGNVEQSDVTIRQQPYYQLVQELPMSSTGISSVTDAEYGFALSSSFGGEQVAVGAPKDTVNVGVFATTTTSDIEVSINVGVLTSSILYQGNVASLTSYNEYTGSGAVYVWDRVIEAFNTITDAVSGTGGQDYRTVNPIASVYKVTLDNIEVTNYTVANAAGNISGVRDTIRFVSPPPIGRVMFVEVNKFNLLERIVGVDSLEGGLAAIQKDAYFGTSLTICSNNCAIYIGAPNYDNGTEYNSGAVWKFHNKGRLYGTNTAYGTNPIFTPGDTIRLNDFEVTVSGRLMPTAFDVSTATSILDIPSNYVSANILALSSDIVANVGQVISQNFGSGYYANVIVLENTTPSTSNVVVASKFITVGGNIRLGGYMTANVFNYGPGNVVTVYANTGAGYNGTVSSAYPMASLDSLVSDINSAGILGVSATNSAGRLRLDSDVTVAKDLLRIVSGVRQPGSAGVLAASNTIVFAFMQIIINPFGNPGEYFGNKVKLAANAYMLVIGSRRGTTRKLTTFDATTTALGTRFDDETTRWFDSIQGSGSVYIYELYDDPRNQVENPGRYAYAQQLDPGDLVPGSQFGAAVDIEGTFITVSAPSATVANAAPNSGTVYIFSNPTMTRGWELIRYQQPKVDVESINRIYLYSNQTNTILADLQFIDPAKGKIFGQAEQEISFKTEYDPAIYNRGSNPAADINTNIYWSSNQVGKVWWNLSRVRYVDYEQDTLTYRSLYWGQLFPGSTIEIYEWVESTVSPSQYVINGGDGIPKYADDSAYVEDITVDAFTGIITTKYYYWVINKTSVDPNDPTRRIPISAVADLIANPKNQNIAYAAMIRRDAIAFYNVSDYLSADNTIMHLDHQLTINSDIIHSEYQLVQKDNINDPVPVKIVDKLIDSLSGIDRNGSTVPDPKLSPADRYGIEIRPRQSMFEDRLRAGSEMVLYVNNILLANPVVEQFSLEGMNAAEPIPNIKLGEYDQSVATEIELEYIDTDELDPGYRVLVLTDIGQEGLWVLYVLSEQKSWEIVRIQSYKTSLYWQYTDWYGVKADGARYSSTDKPDFSVNTTNDALKLAATEGQLIYISNATGNNTWQLVEVETDGSFKVVGIQNGTIQVDQRLVDFAGQGLGFGNQDFDSNRFDQNPNIEIRNILTALKNDIFVNTLQGEFNKLFFVMVNYLLTEQTYVDWLFKSSFISVTHKLRTLSQFPSYVVDNQTYYQDYINEVKPFRTKIREYTIDYIGDDSFDGDITDFDLPAYYDTSTGYGIFRSPSGERPYVDQDSATWQTWPWNQWYNNRDLQVSSIRITNPGQGYTLPPIVTIVSTDGKGSGATALATLDGNTGGIAIITVTDPGSAYTTTPTVIINGSTIGNIIAIGGNVSTTSTNTYTLSTVTGLFVGMTANTAFAADTQITSINEGNLQITMDAGNLTTFTGSVISFGYPGQETGTPATAYAVMRNPQTRNFDTTIKFDRITYDSTVQEWQSNTAYTVGQIITHAHLDGNVMIRKAYEVTANAVSGTTFLASDYTEYAAGRFDNANDRIVGYYEPGSIMPTVDVISVPLTLANSATNTNTIYVYSVDGIFPGMYIGNLGVRSGYITEIVGNVSVMIDSVGSMGTIVGNLVAGSRIVTGVIGDITAIRADEIVTNIGQVLGDYVTGPGIPLNTTVTANTVAGTISLSNQAATTANFANIIYGGTVISVSQITLSVPVSLATNDTITARYESLDQLITGIDYPNAPVRSPTFRSDPLFGRNWDNAAYDGVQYSRDGIALLSTNAYDISLYSLYGGTLGFAPEDLITYGGDFIDTYHSRAPEELVPGITFDTLDMRIYTKIDANANVIAYRVFNNMLGDTGYLRISSANTTALTSQLTINDSEIYVADATKLSAPDKLTATPGVIFINGERITYYRNYSSEVVTWTASTNFVVGSILNYGNVITFSSPITANRGEYIAQANVGANAIVTANVVNSTTVPVYYATATAFSLGANTIQVTSGINAVQISEILASGNAQIWSVAGNSNIRVTTTAVLTTGTEIQFNTSFGNVVGNITYYIESVYGNAATSPTVPVANVIKIANTANGAPVTDLVANFYSNITANVITIVDYNAYPITSAEAYYKTTGNVNSITFNYANVVQLPSLNILSQIHRGTQGTGSAGVYPVGMEVLDGGRDQLVPATANVSRITTTATSGQTVFPTPRYQLRSSTDNQQQLRVSVNGTPTFINAYNEVASSSTTVSYTGTDGNLVTVIVEYGNTITFVTGLTSGSTVVAEVDVYYANVWYNSGIGTITDGLGFTGANTTATNFLRGYPVTSTAIPGVSNPVTTEDAINTLTTETDDEIYTED